MNTTNSPVIMIRDNRGSQALETGSIIRIEALSNYSLLFMADGRKITVSRVLKQFEDLLHAHGFSRIHRSHLVNLSWVQLYHAGSGELRMKNNEIFHVAKRKRGIAKNVFPRPLYLTSSDN